MQHRLSRKRRGISAGGRREIVAACLGLAALVLTGCTTGFDSPVTQVYNPGVGVNDRTGDVFGLALVVVADGEGSGTLVGSLLNQADSEDALAGVEVAAEGDRVIEAELTRTVPLPPEQLVQLHEEQVVTFTGEDLQPGLFVEVTLRFQGAAPIAIQVPTERNEGPYAEIALP